MNKIVTVGREFGSGGRELGRRIAEEMKIAYYDQEIITEIAKRTSISEQYVQNIVEQHPVVSFPLHIGRSFYPVANPVMEQNLKIYQEQSRIIQEIAEMSDCLIVGRCADYILREKNPFRIFVYADMESKMKRCRDIAPEHENLSDKELERHILDIDKKRSRYYSFYTSRPWGDRLNYDLCVNTTQMEIKETARAISGLFLR